MPEGGEIGSGSATEEQKIPFSSLCKLLNSDRNDLLRQLRQKVLRLKEIMDEKIVSILM